MQTPPASISVLMPTWQGAEFLDRALAALAAQDVGVPWDFLAIDSGSTDGTLAILESWRERFPVPLRVQRIHQDEFDHGDTRNLLASRSAGELLVFLTQDAIPAGPRWLATLHRNFADPRVGAAYCRNVARPDASLLTRVFSAADPGYATERREVSLPAPDEYERMDPHARRVLWNFNDVASAIRRDLWELHPFPRTAFGEDVLMARALLEGGWTVVYDAAATVEHSHDYDAAQSRARAEVDGRFNAEWLDRICVASAADADVLVERQLAVDRAALEAAGVAGADLDRALAEAAELRRATFHGLYEGGRSTRRFPATGLLEDGRLKVLYVVHGFPPDTWAGTEVYTLNLALEMQALGHEVVVLTRAPAPAAEADGEAPADFTVHEDELQGLRVLRMTHRLRHGRLRDGYDRPEAAAAFREVLLRERPDLVHFQHLIHLSAGLVQQARDFNLPTVLTCHDYWAICARVQLVRPDGTRCERNQGAGCYLCIADRALDRVEDLRDLERRDPAALAALRATGEAARRHEDLGEGEAPPPAAAPEGMPAEPGFWKGLGDLLDREAFVLDAYRAADLRISPSRFLRDLLVDTAGLDPHTFVFSDNGLRTALVSALEKAPDPDGRLRVGFVGSLVWYKGGETLVRAMNLLADAPVLLNVFGDFRPDDDPHHAALRDLATAGNVRFRGRFDNTRLSEVFTEIDVLVVPSVWWENSPISIHEAILTRTPVVASGIGGMAEYVRDGVDGLHFAPGDAEDLARVLRRFVDEPGLVAKLSRDFLEVKDIADNARETEFRYRGLLARRRARRARLLLDLEGVASSARSGPVEQQGADMLLLRPGGAEVTYDLSLAGGGRRAIRIEVFAVGGEDAVELAGRFRVGGRKVAALAPFRAGAEDEVRAVEFEAELGPDDALRVDTKAGLLGREAFLRIKRVSVGDPGAWTATQPAEARP